MAISPGAGAWEHFGGTGLGAFRMAASAESGSAAPAADVAMWLRAGMAAKNSRGSERGESMTLLLEEEQKKSASAATAKFELENGDAAREAVRREFEAEQLTKTNRQLKGMIVRLRSELKETQSALAEARGGLDLPSKHGSSGTAQPQAQASEEDFRNRTVELINHLREQAKLAEMREKQSVAHVQQQMHDLKQELASAHRLRDLRETRKWALQDWLEGHGMRPSVAECLIPALEEMDIVSADWIKTLETFSPSELEEFVAELPPAAEEIAAETATAVDDALLDAAPASLPSADSIGSARVTQESGDFDPIAAESAASLSGVPSPAAPPTQRRQPSAWDGVPTAESRDAVRILAEMGEAAPLQRCRVNGVLAEDAHVLEEKDCQGPSIANCRGASVVQWDHLSQPGEATALIIRTQFGEGDNLHRVSAAGSTREQLTFFDGVSLGDVSMRPKVIGDAQAATELSDSAAGPGACCAYATGCDEVSAGDEAQSNAHGVYLFNINTKVHTRLPPVLDGTESLELSAHEGSLNAHDTATDTEAGGTGRRVRKDIGLCWSADGEDLVWSSSAGVGSAGLDLVHWHAASGSTRRLAHAKPGESLLALGFAPTRKKLLLVKRIRSVQESQLCLLDLGRGALADGSFRPAPTLQLLFERQIGARPISYGGLAGFGLSTGGSWAGASWGGVSTGSFSGVIYTSDECSSEERAAQRLRYCVIDTESCEVVHDGLLAEHGEHSDIISVACSQQSATVAYVRTVEHGSSCAIHLLDTSEISAAATAGKPLSPEPLPSPIDPPVDEQVEVAAEEPQVGVPGFGVSSRALEVSTAEKSAQNVTITETTQNASSATSSKDRLLITGLQFSADGLQLAVTLQTPRTVADVHVLTTRVDVHKVRSRVWSRWTSSELGGLSAAEVVAARRASYPSEDPWTTNEDGSQPLQIPMLVYEPQSPAPENGWPVVVWLPDNPLTGRGPETSTSLSVTSPVSSTQGCVLDAGIQMLVREIGAAVMVPHVRGSTGYGPRYAALAKQHRREAAVKDVRSLLSWLAQGHPPASPIGSENHAATETPTPKYDLGRIAMYGVGQGGFLAASVSAMLCGLQPGTTTLHIRPRCVALERPVTNLVTFLAETAPYLQEVLRDEFG